MKTHKAQIFYTRNKDNSIQVNMQEIDKNNNPTKPVFQPSIKARKAAPEIIKYKPTKYMKECKLFIKDILAPICFIENNSPCNVSLYLATIYNENIDIKTNYYLSTNIDNYKSIVKKLIKQIKRNSLLKSNTPIYTLFSIAAQPPFKNLLNNIKHRNKTSEYNTQEITFILKE